MFKFLKNYAYVVKILPSEEFWNCYWPGGFFIHGLPTLALHGINSDSAGNYQLIDKESTGRISSADCQHSPSTG
jgi:hypothetical protein